MLRLVLVATAAISLSVGAAYAQQPQVKQGTIKQVPPSDARGMFDSYCAVCHGKTGVGDGPAAKALSKAPADLTKLSARNGGTFPEVRVKRYIEGADEVAAHGTRDMPMWGDLFRSLNRDTAQIRIQALSDLLKGMQVK
jgi:mono/diheme cytochrome c family protein